MVTEKFLIGGVDYTSTVINARLNLARNKGIDRGKLRLAKAAADAIGSIDGGDSFEYQRKITTNFTTLFRGEIDTKQEFLKYYDIEVIAKTVYYQRLNHDATWSSVSIETILGALDDDTGVTIDTPSTQSDITFSTYAVRNQRKFDAVKNLAHYSGQIFWYDHKADKLVVYGPLSYGYKSIELGIWTTEDKIVSIPEYKRNYDHIINTVTLIYAGGSVTSADSTSVALYGTRAATYLRPEIDNSTDATALAAYIKLAHTHFVETIRFKCEKDSWGEDGSGYVYFPLNGCLVDIDDNVNDKYTATYIDEVTLNYPEPFDEVITASNGIRSPLTQSQISNIDGRVNTIERNIDQDVTTSGTPTFDTLTVDSTGSSALTIGGDVVLYRGAANVLKSDDTFHAVKLLGGSSANSSWVFPLQVYGNVAEAIGYFRNSNAGGKGIYVRLETPTDYFLRMVNGTPTTLFNVDTSGNITTVGTVDGVDVSAHAADKTAHQKFPASFEDTGLSAIQSGAGVDEDTTTLSTGYTALIPVRIAYDITTNGAGSIGRLKAVLDDDTEVTLIERTGGADAAGNQEQYQIIDVLGTRTKYIKAIKVYAAAGVGESATVTAEVRGWQV